MAAKRKPKAKSKIIHMARKNGIVWEPMGKAPAHKSKSKAKHRSGGSGIDTVGKAAIATIAFWVLEGGFNYLLKAMKIDLPKAKVLVPMGITALAHFKKINLPGLVTVGTSQTLNTMKANSPMMAGMFDFGNANPRNDYAMNGVGQNQNTARSYAQTMAAITGNQRPMLASQSFSGIMQDQPSQMAFSGGAYSID